jgi:DNA-binding IclR family transcriptional regulator
MPTPRAQTVEKAFILLRCFHGAGEWLSAGELSRRAELPRSSGYRLLETLVELGVVERGPRGRYRLCMMLVPVSQVAAINEFLFAAGGREHFIRYDDLITQTPFAGTVVPS